MTGDPAPGETGAETESDSDGSDRPLRELLGVATEPLYSVDSEGEFEIVNESFVSLTGYDRSELVGMAAVSLIHEDDREEWNRRVKLLAGEETGRSAQWTGRLLSKHGTEIPVEWQFRHLERGDWVVGRARDVREERHKEQKLSVLNRALRHNVRNQMNVIIAKATRLQEVDDEGYRTAAEKIEEIGDNIVTISNKARKAQEHIGIAPDEDCVVDLCESVETVITKFSIQFPNASVEANCPETTRARAPPSVDTAFTELLENAVVHHPTGDGSATVVVEQSGGMVHLRVRDECAPIAEPVIETLSLGSEEPLKHNQGIGLWIVRWVVDSVDGRLSFDRRADDEGNVVTMSFECIEE